MTHQQPQQALGVDTITARAPEASAEPSVGSEELRPEFTAESLSRPMRLAIAGLTLAATVVTASVVASSMVWAEGFMHFGSFAAPAFATLVGIVWMLCLVFGALLENNRALGRRAHRSWFAALVLTGPLAMLLYWALHVWPAPYVPRRDRD